MSFLYRRKMLRFSVDNRVVASPAGERPEGRAAHTIFTTRCCRFISRPTTESPSLPAHNAGFSAGIANEGSSYYGFFYSRKCINACLLIEGRDVNGSLVTRSVCVFEQLKMYGSREAR